MHTTPCSFRARSARPHDAPARPWLGPRPRAAGRTALLCAFIATGATLPACDGAELTPANAAAQVRGATYTLRAVNGAALPARFAPLDDPQRATNGRLESGQITFDADGGARGEWHGAGVLGAGDAGVGIVRIFRAGYVQDGARVLIHSRDDVAPDTATASGTTLTVRAQFFRQPSGERYVVVMTYAR